MSSRQKRFERMFLPHSLPGMKEESLENALQSQSLPAEQPEKSTVIEQTKKEFTREGINCAVNEDQEAVKKVSAQFNSTTNRIWLSGRQQGFYAGMEHASKFTDALIQEITSLRYKLSQQPSQPEDKEVKYRLGRKLNRVILAQDGTKEIAVVTFMPGYEKLAEKVVSILNEHPLHEK